MDAYKDRQIYRNRITATDLSFYKVGFQDTDLYVGTKENHHDVILKRIINARKILDEHIANNAIFLESLSPIGYNVKDDILVKNMCIASKKANVGPMATVAGAFSKIAFDAVANLSDEVIIENGGDLLIRSNKERTIALYAGKSNLSMQLAIKISAAKHPIGICASAGTIGHSLSFGKADMAMVIAKDILLADGLATKLGNMIKTKDHLRDSVQTVFEENEVMGVIGIIGDQIAAVGDIDLIPI